MRKMILGLVLAGVAMPVSAAPLWRDIQINEPRADIVARYPETAPHPTKSGKTVKIAWHYDEWSHIGNVTDGACEMKVAVRYNAAGLADRVALEGVASRCGEMFPKLLAKYGAPTNSEERVIAAIYYGLKPKFPEIHYTVSRWLVDGITITHDRDTVTYDRVDTNSAF